LKALPLSPEDRAILELESPTIAGDLRQMAAGTEAEAGALIAAG